MAAVRVPRRLVELDDVDATHAGDGDTLVYEAGRHVYETATGGAGTLADLTDVTGTPGPGIGPVYDDTDVAHLVPVMTQEDLAAVLASVAYVEWRDITDFQPNWRPTGDPWCVPRYRLTLNNVVHLHGSVSCADATIADATWIPIFQFPEDSRPGANLRFNCLSNDNSISKLIVWEDGWLVWGGYMLGPHQPVGYVTLDPVNFSVG